jgi:hypothetical protein
LGEGGESAAVGEGQSGSDVDARLRSGSEPGRRRVSAVSSKSSPEAAEDSVELRSVSTDMAGGVGGAARAGLSFGSPVTQKR